jgi:hypothetical protein
VRDDLDQEIRCGEFPGFESGIEGAVLVAHGAGRDTNRAVVQGADQCIGLDCQGRLRQLLGKAPQLASPGDRWVIVEKHLMGVTSDFTLKGDRDHLAAFGVVAESRRIWHADELVIHHRLGQLERLRHQPAQCLGIRPVLDDEVLAVDEAVGAGWKGRVRQRHGKCRPAHGALVHRR